jgi:putative chitinase
MSFEQALNKLWSRAPQKTRQAVIENAPKFFAKYKITTPLAVAHFMAQISHECGGGTIIRENMNYSADRMLFIFGVGKHSAKVTREEAERLVGHPEQIAERVYGLGNPKKAKELGNTRPGDGWRYRGAGMLQLTGGYNFEHRGKAIGYDLYNNPEQLNNPAISFAVACAEFAGLGCVALANADNGSEVGGINAALIKVTKKVNGGRNGIADRAVWLRKWKAAMPGVEEPVWAPRAAEVDETPGLFQTRTGQIATATGTVSAVGTASQVINTMTTTTEAVQTASDTVSGTISTVAGAKESAVVVYQTVHPFLGILPDTWRIIAICCGVAVVAGVIAIMAYRYWKLRDTGE